MADPLLAVKPTIEGLWDDVPEGLYLLSYKDGKLYATHSGPHGRALACFTEYELAVAAERTGRRIFGRPGAVELRSFNECIDVARRMGCRNLAIWSKPAKQPTDWFHVGDAQ